MKKAFYILGIVYFAYELANHVFNSIEETTGILSKYVDEEISRSTKRQPIGFAVETTKC